MKIEYQKTIKVDELAHLVPTKQGATFAQLWQIFYYIRLLKYVSRKNLIQIKSAFNKICTNGKLQQLCDLGYLKSPKEDIYCATNKVLPILKEAGYTIETLPKEPIGLGDINELHNTNVFIQLIKQEYFYTLLYPNFTYLIPDALLIELNKETKKYKLTFLEIEEKKPNWETYLKKKKENYIRLSKDIEVYHYWTKNASLLGFSIPAIEDFKFTISIFSKIKKN